MIVVWICISHRRQVTLSSFRHSASWFRNTCWNLASKTAPLSFQPKISILFTLSSSTPACGGSKLKIAGIERGLGDAVVFAEALACKMPKRTVTSAIAPSQRHLCKFARELHPLSLFAHHREVASEREPSGTSKLETKTLLKLIRSVVSDQQTCVCSTTCGTG